MLLKDAMAGSNLQLKTEVVVSDDVLPNKFAKFELEFRRIQKLVDESVNKLTFAMTMPKLLDNNFELIKPHLTQDQLEMFEKMFSKYFPSELEWMSKETTSYSKLSCMSSLNKIQEYFNSYSSKIENVPQRDEYGFSTALQLLYENEEIRKIATSNQSSTSEAGFNFVQDIKLFFYSIIDKMKLTPQEAETKELYLRKLCLHHQELTDEAHILEEEAREEISTNQELLKIKLSDVLSIRERSDSLMEECRQFIQKSGSDANEQMIFNWKSSEYNKESLEDKVQKQMVDLEMLRKKYVDEEKELRTKRYKTEQHLISFLEQYDKDMQNKQNELDMQEEVVYTEKEQFNALNMQFKEQETVYDILMQEKAEYEKRLFEAKLYELKCSVSARKIQRFYKNFKRLLRIAGKKDLLKTKKRRRNLSTKIE
ncbi:uncharacterized protein [Halyomorpha halys]|uniref:uncharacterized protein isoform X2 n=1 Tax=Halyomorpha halys TaxID=286706 RepID=UPI0006D51DB0|nr:IQ domain-containing protein D isoform X2 [Halyomorpha halys]